MADAKPKPKAQGLRRADLPQGPPAPPDPQRPDPDRPDPGRHLPGRHQGAARSATDYEVKAVFENAANIRKDSPVRIAGVNVGKVQSVRSVGDAAEVTFTVDEEGQPIREDAQVEIRPRIFLEGNFFLDLKPGSPSAPELPDGGVIPITQTSTGGPARPDPDHAAGARPREPLEAAPGYGDALNTQPTAADDRAQDPDIQGESAAQAINDSFEYGADAARDSAIVNEALLGTEPDDLSQADRRQRQGLRRPARARGAAQGPDHQLQHLQRAPSPPSPRTSPRRSACSPRRSRTRRRRCATRTRPSPTCARSPATSSPASRELPATIAVSRPVAEADPQAAVRRTS